MSYRLSCGVAGHGPATRASNPATCFSSQRFVQLHGHGAGHVLVVPIRHVARFQRCRASAAVSIQVQELPATQPEGKQDSNKEDDEKEMTVVEDVVQGLLSLLWVGALVLSVVAAFKFSTFQAAKVAGNAMTVKSPILISAAASFVGVLINLFARVFFSSWAFMRYGVLALAAFFAWFFAG